MKYRRLDPRDLKDRKQRKAIKTYGFPPYYVNVSSEKMKKAKSKEKKKKRFKIRSKKEEYFLAYDDETLKSSESIRSTNKTHTLAHAGQHRLSCSQKPSWRAARDCALSSNWVRLTTDAVNATVVDVLNADRNLGNFSVL